MHTITVRISTNDREFAEKLVSTLTRRVSGRVKVRNNNGKESARSSARETAIDLLTNDVPAPEVMAATGLTKGQVAALKAHVTRGSYN